jgi:hypothetical protein
MELADLYMRVERFKTFHYRTKHPLILKQDITLGLTLNREILHLKDVVLNNGVEATGYLRSWKEGTVAISLPPHIESLLVYEVSFKWN